MRAAALALVLVAALTSTPDGFGARPVLGLDAAVGLAAAALGCLVIGRVRAGQAARGTPPSTPPPPGA